jgi:hypothetical protein
MSELKGKNRGRVLMAGKVIFNFGQSTIDCLVRRITDDGAITPRKTSCGVEAGTSNHASYFSSHT